MRENVGSCPFENERVYPMTKEALCDEHEASFGTDKNRTAEAVRLYYERLILLVADVFLLSGIKGQVADGSNQAVDTEGDHSQEDVSAGSTGEAFGLQ